MNFVSPVSVSVFITAVCSLCFASVLSELNEPRRSFSLLEPLVSLTRRLSAGSADAEENLVMSPLSILATLNLLLLASSGNTYRQLRNALHYPADLDVLLVHQMTALQLKRLLSDRQTKNNGAQLDIATRIFADRSFSFEPWFVDNAVRFYSADITSVQFSRRPTIATNQINNWVSNATRGKIPQLFADALPRSTQLLAANAVYFNGSWQMPFDARLTRQMEFHVDNSRSVTAEVMFAEMNVPMASFPDEGFTALSLPYKGGRLSMLVLLPDASGARHVTQLEAALSADKLDAIVRSLQTVHAQVWLPKFRYESHMALHEQLQNMGVTDIFQESRAMLSRMSRDRDLFLSSIEHQALIEVNEAGTEAAAVTVTLVNRDRFVRAFRATHPFLYIVRDDLSGTPLFWGRLINPK